MTNQELNIVISGASGLIGTLLSAFLEAAGHQVRCLVRRVPVNEQEIFWRPATGELEIDKLEGVDAVIHLSGENVADGRWNTEKKARILDSRVQSTRLLTEGLLKLTSPPSVFLSASATGFYGHRGNEILTEKAGPGQDFLAEVCQAWEAASLPLETAGIRLIHARIGVVLSPQGGALAKLKLPFSLGLGGQLGNGNQYMSWIAIDDLVRAVYFCLLHPEVSGPVNLVAPDPIKNRRFTRILGQALQRPTLIPVPRPVIKTIFGEMGEAVLLSSARVVPEKLQQAGFTYQYSELKQAFEKYL